MNTEPAFLLTGATGFLGQRMLRRLLHDGAKLIVLGRGAHGPAGSIPAEARVAELVAKLGCSQFQDRVAVVEADIADLDSARLATHIQAQLLALGANRLVVVNVAASLRMDFPGQAPARREAICELNQRTNVLGLRRLLDALDRVDAVNAAPVLQSFVHFSTCYAHGRRRGLLPEAALDPSVKTENSYESSKREGELSLGVWQAQRATRIPVTVIRPSIVTRPDTDDGYLAWLNVLGEPVRLNCLPAWQRWLSGTNATSARVVDLMAGAMRRERVGVEMAWSKQLAERGVRGDAIHDGRAQASSPTRTSGKDLDRIAVQFHRIVCAKHIDLGAVQFFSSRRRRWLRRRCLCR